MSSTSRQRVEPLEDQVDALALGNGCGVELRVVGPRRAPDPGESILVLVQIGIGNEVGGQQIGVHTAGHRGRHPRRRHLVRDHPGALAGADGDSPAIVELTFHRTFLLTRYGSIRFRVGWHYLTAPAVTPATKWRWASRKPMTTGTLTTRAAAMIWFQ